MYRLSISSLLVVLVTLQQHNTAAAQSLAEQFEQLMEILDANHCITHIDECSEVSVTYGQLNDLLHTISAQPNCTSFSTSEHQSSLEQLFFKSFYNTTSLELDDLTVNVINPYVLIAKPAEDLNFYTHYHNDEIDQRDVITALNCILLI